MRTVTIPLEEYLALIDEVKTLKAEKAKWVYNIEKIVNTAFKFVNPMMLTVTHRDMLAQELRKIINE